jgi:hypothetical protein
MPKMGLVLQGGGAFWGYEYGAVTRLVERVASGCCHRRLDWSRYGWAVAGAPDERYLPRRSNAQRRRTALWLARKID